MAKHKETAARPKRPAPKPLAGIAGKPAKPQVGEGGGGGGGARRASAGKRAKEDAAAEAAAAVEAEKDAVDGENGEEEDEEEEDEKKKASCFPKLLLFPKLHKQGVLKTSKGGMPFLNNNSKNSLHNRFVTTIHCSISFAT